MAHPVIAATNNSAEASDATEHTVLLPAGIQAGETLLVYFAVDANPFITFPEGWTEFLEYDASSCKLAAAWRKADGLEGSSITVTTSSAQQSVHISHRITGATDPTVTPPEVSTGADGTSTNPNPDSLSPSGGSKDYLWIALAGNDDDNSYSVYPLPDNQESYISSEGFGTCSIAVCTDGLTQATLDPSAFTMSASDKWAAVTIAVYPAEVGDVTVDAPLVAVDSQALAGSLSLDRVFSSPLVAVDSEAQLPTMSLGLTLLSPVVSVDSEALIPIIIVPGGVTIDVPLAAIDGEALTPSMVLDKILDVPLVGVDSEALAAALSLGLTLQAPLVGLDAEALIVSLVLDKVLAVPLALIDSEALIAVITVGAPGEPMRLLVYSKDYCDLKTYTGDL